MKAIVITEPGGAGVLQLRERTLALPGEHEVVIEVKACGVNRPDIFQRKGNYPAPAGFPADIPGLEVAGTIKSSGKAVSRWKPGDQVCALVGGGGYATEVLADGRHCLPIPPGWSYSEASSLPETVFTVWHNVFQRGQLTAGEHLLVHGGSSGIGITAIQLAKAFGARVSVTAGSEAKCAACYSLGADKCINYKEEDFETALVEDGPDVILDMVGGDYTAKNLRLLKADGRLVFINSVNGSAASFDIPYLMRRRLTITGSTLRSRDVIFKARLAEEIEKNVWPLLADKKFNPVIFRQFNLDDAAASHQLMESGDHIGKIILVNNLSP
jgi:putative PIG3 family NAD(P)H quinone oxidoreductase